MATAFESPRVGLANYLVPLAFGDNPTLLWVGPAWLSIISTLFVLCEFWVLSTGLEGWYRGRFNPLQRIAGLAIAVLLLLPLPPMDLIGGVEGYVWNVLRLVGAAILRGWLRRYRQEQYIPRLLVVLGNFGCLKRRAVGG